jgi:phosphopantothenoylcysteine decarboxylase
VTADEPVVYVIASSAPPALHLEGLLKQLIDVGRQCCVIATPTLATWMDLDTLSVHTPWPIRVHPRTPADRDPLPPADAVLAAPLTFNSLNKWAAGISDTLALGLLNEAIGLGVPIVAAPVVKAALRQHPAYASSIATLRGCGVYVLDPDETTIRPPEGLVTLDWPQVVRSLIEASER